MPTLRHAASLAALLLTVACSPERDAAVSNARTTAAVASRTFAIDAETLWVRGGAERDSVFVEPWYVAAGHGTVFVSDAERGLLAFTDSGQALREGGGAIHRGLLGPIVVFSDSTVAVVRRSDGALHLFDAAGARLAHVPATEAPEANGMCALDAYRVLLAGGPRSLTIADRRGGPPLALPFPWQRLRDSSILLQQTVVASSVGREGCVVAQVVGNEFAVMDREDSVRFHRFIEAIEIPPVRQTVETAGDQIATTSAFVSRVSSAESVAMDDSLIFVAFAGSSARREGVVDVYDRESGAYRASVRIGVPIRALSAGNGALYVLHAGAGLPALLALRLTLPEPPGLARTP